MEELACSQVQIGEEIHRIITNFKKDPHDRKTTKGYFEDRLRRLEDYWSRFEEIDNQIRALPNPSLDHPYFAKEYYKEISNIYENYKTLFLERIKVFECSKENKESDNVSTPSHKEREDSGRVLNNSEVRRIVRRQRGIIQSLRRLLDGIAVQQAQFHSQQYYDIKLCTIRQLWSQIEEHNYSIWENCEEPALEGCDANEYADLEEEVQSCLIQLSTASDESSKTNTTAQPKLDSSLKLPKITLPKFDGDYTKWRQFADLFTQMVHNQGMADCQKMWYLKANVTGEAEKLVRHLTLSNENYSSAWKMLEDRYENKRLLAAALINTLLSQPVQLRDASATSIRNFHDTTQECLLGLENMGIPVANWDPLLLHILIKKLDTSTHTLYEQSLENPRELQSIKSFLMFLQNRFQSLEVLGTKVRHTVKTSTSVIATSSLCLSCKGNHPLYACKTFLKLSPTNRLNLVRKHNVCVNCFRFGHHAPTCTLRGCTKCSKKHNSLVHLDKPEKGGRLQLSSPKDSLQENQVDHTLTQKQAKDQSLTLTTFSNQEQKSYVLLSTAMVRLTNINGKSVDCRAILDSGSQINIVTERITRKLGLTSTPDTMIIQGIGCGREQTQKRVSLRMESLLSGFCQRLEAYVLPNIIPSQPTERINTSTWPIPNNIKLADPNFHHPNNIDLLIGAEFYHQLLTVGQIRLADDLPILQNTLLGWIVSGKINKLPLETASCGICTEEGLETTIEKFWRLEEMDMTSPIRSSAENKCETHFWQTTRRNSEGHFVVSLPFSDDPRRLGDSKDVALRRFLSLEKRLAKDNDLKLQYVAFMKEYRDLGHMEEVNMKEIQAPHYFIPHHSVLKPESTTTKLRVVFDASAKTSSNLSLNDILYAGPTVQDDLFAILLRFRSPRYVFTADIQKMYRQVILQPADRKFHLIYWRDDPSHPLKCYQLCTVTYGTTSAPYLATQCLQILADEQATKYPLGSQALRHDFYVDDVMTGSNNLFTAIEIQTQLISILQGGGFKLRKWCGNHPRLLQNIPAKDQEIQLDFSKEAEERIKTLGLTWLPKTDQFCVKTAWTTQNKVTKRIIASDIARLFDPLGMLAPVIVKAKILLQQLWQLKLDWDAALPQEIITRWTDFKENLTTLNNIQFPRHVFGHEIPKTCQIHTFADASELAYGAAVYIRTVTTDNKIIVRLLCAKSRVAPIKRVTVPRLELCAAKLAAELTKRIKVDLKMEDTVTYLWTDSEIVLAWINSQSSSFHTFVGNRIAAIQELTIPQQWRHVGTKENPADVLSRGLSPQKLESCHIWFYGPKFLHGSESIWPLPYTKKRECDLEKKQVSLPLTKSSEAEDLTAILNNTNHSNSFRKLQRILAYVLRLISVTKGSQNHSTVGRLLSTEELDNALQVLVKIIQRDEFKEELQHIEGYKEVKNSSSLSTLTPFLDKEGILRVGGRLESGNLSYDAKHPMLLPYNHPWTKLLMTDIHKENLHAGPQSLLSITRQRFWPIKGKIIARSIVQHCVNCTRAKPKMLSKIMGNLPPHRVLPSRPFVNTAVDFCGPLWVHFKLRGKRPQKCYIAVFCCFSTKALHLELVSDLTTDAFIGALKRFTSRRGRCKKIYCDNATNFVGARNQLDELNTTIYSDQSKEKITFTCSSNGIDFHFIPPRAPHFGGLWEAAVKSAKHLLQRGVGSASLTYEELETVIVEIEGILNSRPITPMSADPNDLTALTPGHFLIGEPLTATIDSKAEPLKASLLSRWKLVSHLKHEFWRRWTQEYLNELQQRVKWKKQCQNIEPGSMVIIREDNTPVLKWPLGRIIHTYKGNDGYVRVADVRTTSGVLKRPIHRLALLPVYDDIPKDDSSTTFDERTNGSSPLKRQMSTYDLDSKDPSQSTHQEPSTSKIPKKRSRTRTISGSTVGTILLACCMLPIIRSSPIHINQFDPKPGIHYDSIGKVNLISTEWSLVVYYDLRPYWNEFETFSKGIEALQHLCLQRRQKSSCRFITEQFQHIKEEITTDNELLSYRKQSNRRRRGAINVIGNVANSLFGLLDSEYAEQMSKTIKNVKENEEHLLSALRNQTSIIDSTLNIIKNDEASVEQRFKTVNDQITQIFNRINDSTTESLQTKLQQIFTSLAIQMTLISTNLRRIQSAIYDVASDTHHGRINPQLLSPHQLKKELARIRNHLLSSYRLPADQDNILQFYTLMTVKGRIINNYVIFQLKLPLLSIENFDLFRLIPVPTVVNNTLVAIKPSSSLMAVNLHRDQYYMLTDTEFSSCRRLHEENYMCNQLHPTYQRGAAFSKCEIDLLNHIETSPDCKLEEIQTSPVWIQLSHTNEWIYAVKKETATSIVCGNAASSIVLKGSGLLTMNPDCVIKQDLLTIQGHHIYPSRTRVSYTKLGGNLNITAPKELMPLIKEVASYKSHIQEITNLQNQLSSQNLMNLPRGLQTHTIHTLAVGYLGLACTILIIFFLIYKYKPGFCTCPQWPTRVQPQDKGVPRSSIEKSQQEDLKFVVHI